MPASANPYYNSQWDDAAKSITEALVGNPEKAGQIAYQKASAALADSKTARQNIENQALTDGLVQALAAGGNQPDSIAANMPALMATMAQAGITDPSKYLGPQWAMQGEAQSGASPAEALVRAAYAGGGHAIPLDLALTPDRADNIRAQDAAARVAVARAGSAGQKAVNPDVADVDRVLKSFFTGIPGATAPDQYERPQFDPSALQALSGSGALEGLRGLAAGALRGGGGEEAARQTLFDALHIPPGTSFEPDHVTRVKDWIPFNDQTGPAFVAPDGATLDFSKLLQMAQGAAPAGPAAMAPAAGGGILDEARVAIQRGAPRDAVIARLRQQGIDPGGL